MAACRSCGAVVPEAARFCPACGTAVGGPAGEERKVVTVLFADIVDSTASAEARDPEDVRAALRPHLARMRGELERFGGTFEKYVGDAVMAVFGAPVAHEDDPERAVRAALAIRDAVSGVRVAVNTGEAVVSLAASSGTPEGIATGDVVNTTFRIEEAAEADTVLVGESTYRATQSVIEYGERRLLRAKGKTEPLAVYEALRASIELRPTYEGPPLAPLVGRREELSLVLDTIARAKRDRTVQLVTLVGVPGIGKSRLVWELQRALVAEPGLVTWRRGRCLPYGDGVTYWALGEMVKTQAGILETDDAAAAEVKLERAVRDLLPDASEAAWVEAHLRPLLGLDGAGASGGRDEAFAAWRRFFEALADWAPLVLVFEDLHWADDGLLDFIDHVADWATQWPLVLLCTARPELHERRPGWGARTNAATILLPPLNAQETGSLVGFLLLQRAVPPGLQQALRDRAEGNPLYAEEFVRMLVDRGLLVRVEEGWELVGGDLPVPESVHAIIAARIDALRPREKAVIRDASVVGRGFWPNAVAAVSGVDGPELESLLLSLERKELVRRLGTSAVADDPQYSFHHALVRDVAYAQIPRAERSRKHRLAAEWIDSLGRPEDHSETIAHHYLRALEYAPPDGNGLAFADRARSALRDAGDRAFALNSFASAERFYAAALELNDSSGVDGAELVFRLGRARCFASGEGLDLLERARGELLEHGERGKAAEAQALIARTLFMQGKTDEAGSRFDDAAGLLASEPPSASKAFVLAAHAGFLMAGDRGPEAVEAGRAALEMAEELGLDELRASARATIGTARVATGDLGGVEDLREGIRIAGRANSPELIRAELNLGSVLANLGQLAEAAEAHERGRGAAERLGDPGRLRWFQVEHAYELYWKGRADDALEVVEAIVAEVDSGAPHVAELDARLIRGWVALDRGDLHGAMVDAERALKLGRSYGEPQLLFPALAFHARALLECGAEDQAADDAAELLEAWVERLDVTFASFWVGELAIVLLALGRGDELLRHVADVRVRTRWLEAAAATCRGDLERARKLYVELGSTADAERLIRLRPILHRRTRAAPRP